MSRRVSIEQRAPKGGRIAIFLGAGLLIAGVLAIWALQFHVSMQNNVFADFSEEFEETSSQIQYGIDLVENASDLPAEPGDLLKEQNLKTETFEERAQERLIEEQSPLPISQ